MLGRHRKLHLFDIDIPGRIAFKESDVFTPGDDLQTFVYDDLAFAVIICYDIRFPELARQAALQRLDGHQHHVVLVVAERTLALGAKQADHLAREGFHAQALAQHIVLAEQLAAHAFANDADGRARLEFIAGEFAPCHQRPVAGGKPGVGAADHAAGPVAPTRHQRGRRPRLGCHGHHAANLLRDHVGIGVLEGWRGAGAGPHALAGAHLQQIGAQPGDLVLHGARGAIAQRDHGDHRTHADHDTQHREERTQQIAANGAQR
ncbi:hypothetical protein SDC9_93749 [bioreactor metagenome]|uniref:CN hydrolase domain-containing protein n=1 Tax=bioreactor metagenome TaxID=1076179 RepID=A0A645A457_9ZZZZ